ncbi:MAG: ABC transporter ATP-binding protein/permease [candidate division Zixibacteria bacterium]|nr:ABC transporter ATP-binding protein/permease [candidate division Zixibacteria bacterium]MDH3937263.1 ABC transporter ATP-binding protein/permease [candidate division Zixibacteria bacterium]MDH4033202.1 ABC transporter ATP-binding protein/permease [candidate division Zixibacteria bacterium]
MTTAIKTFKRLWRYLRPYWQLELLTFITMVLITGVTLAVPLSIQYMIDDLIPALSAAEQFELKPIVLFGLVLVAIYFFNVLFTWIRDYLIGRISAGIVRDVRSDLFYHLEQVSLRFHHRNSVGELMSRVLSDVDRIQELMTSVLLMFLANVLMLAAILIYLLQVNWVLTLIALIPVPLTILLSHSFGRRMHRLIHEYQQSFARLSARLQEALSSLTTVIAFGQEKRERARVDKESNRLGGWIIRSSVTASLSSNLIHFVNMLGPIVVLAWGTYLVAGGSVKLGALIAFYLLLTYLYQPVQDLASINVEIQSALASVYRIFEYLDLEPAVVEDSSPICPKQVHGQVEFNEVRFWYEEDGFVLDIERLNVQPGETVAVVGPSGAGKTSLINLLLRFFDPQKGSVLIDGIDIKRLGLHKLRGSIGLVEQSPVLFKSTIFENIAYANSGATAEQVQNAARVANIADFVDALDNGYQTEVGERGVTMSGGERQRICLARALLKDPPILILDEATSALDSTSEQLIQQSLRSVLTDKTAIIIAHRLATVQFADRILVMENGRIAASGTHDQLMTDSDTYRELAANQMIS